MLCKLALQTDIRYGYCQSGWISTVWLNSVSLPHSASHAASDKLCFYFRRSHQSLIDKRRVNSQTSARLRQQTSSQGWTFAAPFTSANQLVSTRFYFTLISQNINGENARKA